MLCSSWHPRWRVLDLFEQATSSINEIMKYLCVGDRGCFFVVHFYDDGKCDFVCSNIRKGDALIGAT